MEDSGKLQDYPGLARWYQESLSSPPAASQLADGLLFATCQALSADGESAVRLWVQGFRRFLDQTSEPLADFLGAEQLAQNCDAELVDLIGEFGEAAIRAGQTTIFFDVMQAGADRTGLLFLRFLAAWTALNAGNLEDCVAECDKVEEPFASIFTLQGQALLELGRPKEAIEALNIAVGLSPSELMAWFQLAKAHHVSGALKAAFNAVTECRRLAPQSEEVALYMAMIANEEGNSRDFSITAMQALKPHLPRHSANVSVVFQLLRLAMRLADKDATRSIVAMSDWSKLAVQTEFIRPLSNTLKKLHELGWMDVASELLSGAVPNAS